MKKKIITVVLAVVMLLSFSSVVMATYGPKPSMPASNPFSDFGGQILGYVQWVGYAIAIGMLIYIGIKYTMASADQKADLKAGLIKYVIGAVLIAGASTIAGWLFSMAPSAT